MKFFNTFFASATIAAVTSCASISTPEGGEKDTASPTLKNSNPKNQALNVNTQTITLEFDEEVQPNNLQRELLITPFTENNYKVRTNRERMELTFDQPLEQNTTYTFNFRKGVQDITEKNIAENLQLTFSTGAFIDSSRVSGKVVDLLTQAPEKEAVVALYPAGDTTDIRKSRPYYQTQTSAAGEFSFENIKEGPYRIYALIDKNNNAIYDSESEKVAYLTQAVNITPQPQEVALQTVKLDTKKPILQRRENFTDRFVANYNEGISSFSGAPAQSPKDSLIYKIGTDGKAIDIFGGKVFSGGEVVLTALDSAGNRTTDTLKIAFEGKRAQRIKGAQLKQTQAATAGNYRVGQAITIELETPVRITSKEPVSIMADSLVLRKLKYPEEVSLDRTATEMTFTLPAVNGNKGQISLALDSLGIVPVQGTGLRFPRLPITIAENRGAGSVKGTVTTKETSYTIELLNDKYKPVQQIRNKSTFNFRNIEPGNYYLRVLVDENKDGKWTAADPELKRAAEKVYLYPKPLDIRANWEMEGVKLEF
ncbi:Ig-like domain-containing protein [Pontibacter ruber]|uniref:Ig-like domain-containing protein n=1 Tax=Pontibacter ruber TaxID=1343895 RepID=A0ABW5CW89_9BACT|nr:Ig-like domain-containing domain [Pontibacter ruber]